MVPIEFDPSVWSVIDLGKRVLEPRLPALLRVRLAIDLASEQIEAWISDVVWDRATHPEAHAWRTPTLPEECLNQLAHACKGTGASRGLLSGAFEYARDWAIAQTDEFLVQASSPTDTATLLGRSGVLVARDRALHLFHDHCVSRWNLRRDTKPVLHACEALESQMSTIGGRIFDTLVKNPSPRARQSMIESALTTSLGGNRCLDRARRLAAEETSRLDSDLLAHVERPLGEDHVFRYAKNRVLSHMEDSLSQRFVEN